MMNVAFRKNCLKLGAVVLAAAVLAACGPSEPKTAGAPPDMRRLTDEQYHNIISDVFGPNIVVGGRGDPLLRVDGLLQVGARSARVTPSGVEQYYAMAKSIAAQVVSPEYRGSLVPCQPKDANAPDEACTKTYFQRLGRILYRHPLSDADLKLVADSANTVADTTHDFYRGLAFGLEAMLVSPKFLFVVDETEAGPNGGLRLTNYSKASRLSFFLWNTTPDEELLGAAEKGELNSKNGLTKQVERMMKSHRVDGGVRAFFADFLGFDRFENLEKDTVIYPAYSVNVALDAREQLLRTITDTLLVQNADYRDIFTTRKTFLTSTLGRIYQVAIDRPDGGWMRYEFPQGDQHVGIVTQIGFVALASHPGRSSPTIRGKAIRELLLCQHVPDPPGDVDFSLFNDLNSPNKTARQRLSAHATTPTCAGCHKVTDPIGLGLEHFDGIGQMRDSENGELISTAGDLDGIAYKDAAGLAQAIHDNPSATTCVVNRLAAYALGRSLGNGDKELVNYLSESFSRDGFKFSKLMETIALGDALYTIKPPAGATAANAETSNKEPHS